MKIDQVKRLILIDDDAATNAIHLEIIDELKASWNLSIIQNSSTAIEDLTFMINNIETEDSALIILDLNMPGYNGWDILEKINWDSQPDRVYEKLKLVILTASRNPSDREKSMEYKNVLSYLTKPITGEKIMNLFN